MRRQTRSRRHSELTETSTDSNRKPSFWLIIDWLVSQVADFAIYTYHFLRGFDWDSFSDFNCLLTGSCMSTLLLFCRFGRISSTASTLHLMIGGESYDASMATNTSLTTIGSVMLLVESVLIALSVSNAWLLFSSSRRYQLLYANQCNSDNARRNQITLPTIGRPNAAAPSRAQSTAGLIQRLSVVEFMRYIRQRRRTSPAVSRVRNVWELYRWDPSTYRLKLFCVESSSFLWHFAVWCALSLTLYLLVKSFLGLLRDNLLIASEAQNEYNLRFVYPRVFPGRADVGTSMQSEVVQEIDDLLHQTSTVSADVKHEFSYAAARPPHSPIRRTYSAMWKNTEPSVNDSIIDENFTPRARSPPAARQQAATMMDSPAIRRIRRSARNHNTAPMNG